MKAMHRSLWVLSLWAVASLAAEPPKEASNTPTPAQSTVSAGAVSPDKLSLDATVITGNRELPKVLYIVPWKKADLGDLPGQPFNTLLDETLVPVDRDVFRREVDYHQAITVKKDVANAADGK